MQASSFQKNLRYRGIGHFAAMTTFVILSQTSSVFAQDFEGKRVSEVSIQYKGAHSLDENAIRNQMSTKVGGEYHAEMLDRDVKALYESGAVEDIRFLADPVGTDAVRVIAEVTTRSTLSGIGFQGNTKFSDSKLAKEAKLKADGSFSDAELLTSRRNIEKYYQGYGFPDVKVSHKVQKSSTGNSSDVIFVIDEGLKNEVRHIRFQGNDNTTDIELRKEMKTKEKGFFSFITKSGQIQSNQLDDDLNNVLDYYRNHGYLRVKSTGVQRIPVKNGKIDLLIPIQEGARYTVNQVGFGAMTVFKSPELYPALSLNNKDSYSAKKMRADMDMIRSYYGSKGYADAVVNPVITDAGTNKVNILYKIIEGQRFNVGRVNIQGNVKTKDKVIRREVPLKPGDPFNSVELETTKSRLENMRYFDSVQASGENSGGGYRDVNILVEEKNTGSVSVGAGFSTIDNVVGFLTLEQSNFDLFNPWNFTGGGQRFSATLRGGSQRQEASISLLEPWFLDRQLQLGGELFYKSAAYYSSYFRQSNAGGALSLRKPLTEKSSLKFELRPEQIKISPENEAPAEFEAERGTYLRNGVNVSYIYNGLDSVYQPREGSKIDASLNYAGGALGGDVDTIGLSVQAQHFWNLKWDTIFSLSGEVASVDSFGDKNVPIFDRVFLGGPRTLRGFEFRDVGGNRAGSEALGGKSLAYISGEYTVPIIDSVRAAVFYDTGFVNKESWSMSPTDLYSDYGIGLRVKLPIAEMPISLDYAIPLKSPDPRADKGGQFNFYLNYSY